MIFKNIKIIFRELFKNKVVNGINITGLAIGIAAILFIVQYIWFETSFDSFIQNNDRIYRLVFNRYYTTGLDQSVGNSYLAGQIARENIPEVENFVRCKKSTQFLQVEEDIFKEERAFFADSSFFDLFSYPVVSGVKSDFLREPNVAVITESLARKYFGDEDPIGKTIYRVNPGKTPLLIQGVVKDVPENSHLKFDVIISLASELGPSYCYTCNNTNTYFLLREGSNPNEVAAKITDYALEFLESRGMKLDFKIEYELQKLTDIHLHSHYRFEHEANGNYGYLIALMIVAFFILLSAWLNYTNIYKSLIKRKIKSLGVRKINGASWRSFAMDFISETWITGLISLILAFAIISLLFPTLKSYLHLEYSFDFILRLRTILYSILIMTGISIGVGIILTLRYLKTIPLNMVLTKSSNAGNKRPKNFVLIAQFSIAVFLIASTMIAIQQIHYMQDSALSMNIDQVLTVKRSVDGKYNTKQREFEQSLKNFPGILETSYSTVTPGEKNGWVKGGIAIKGTDLLSDQFFQSNVAPGFFDFFDVKLLAGRSFFPDETNWEGGPRHIILNKQAALALGAANYEDILGKILVDNDDKNEMGEVVGVVDGYFQNSLDQEVMPTIFNPDQFGYFIFIKFHNENPVELVSKVKAEYQEYFKDSYFEYFFLDDYFNQQYQSHIQFNRCFILFSIMAIIISILSLLGAAIMSSVERIKEIGIRKVNGARITEILVLLNTESIKGVIIAIIIATPLAWYTMHKWLENFAYKTTLSWWIFALAGLLALGIALLTVSWQSWRAATRNPVEALRYE
ncbi:FtsX-like permease family protein [Maribellus comscasis]|uniref:FtsX-like permease family protein n=1 Tax=Maribellus comscasis TaxID=2681766 RepID=A0A6I6JUC5_9BACT|nr:ABC transporter permease [Maribellus comscasis]QGY44670.1 FtsX-like permease family protein [Maribellus comscasis]